MRKLELTQKEQLMLYGLVKYPYLSDKDLSNLLKLKHSTVTSIRNRLRLNDYFRRLVIPRLQNLGCKMLVTIYTSFNPLIPLEERVEITGKTIEVFEEIFFSVGELDKGFSLSLSKDYATIGKINDIRTQTFGGRGLLEEEYPNMVILPFEISKTYRFFDYSPLIKKRFNIDIKEENIVKDISFKSTKYFPMSDTEKNVFCMIVSYPEMSDNAIGSEIGVSRHTVSRIRRKFYDNNLIRKIILPNLKKLGFEILAFYHIRFDPSNPPDMDHDDSAMLMSDSTIFFACRRFESVMLSIYENYDDYKSDMMNIMQILKQNRWISKDPVILTYSLNTLIYIKDFIFAPITHKIVGCDFWVKKLLNI